MNLASFIVPAHDEERHVGECVAAIRAAAGALDLPAETIVVDDASTDSTAAVAEGLGARVIRVEHRQIAATRNAGARAARGDVLFFVDADTLANGPAVQAAVEALRDGAAGGGCLFDLDGPLPLWARILQPAGRALLRLLNVTGGCFLFCTRAVFDEIGGFSERYFALEDRPFIQALKRKGRFVVPRPRVVTSGRKARSLSLREALALIARMAIGGPEAFTRREGLDAWYGPRDEGPRP
jgi:glycosyltransferase involved in cell wall biosynthesis